MSRIASRTRIVNFRLSEEEYRRLTAASAATGSRCLSDYARAAVLSESHLQDRLQVLGQKLSNIGARLEQVLGLEKS